MNQKQYKTYHDLVIKDGQFIGEFEKMYKEFVDPWGQSKQPNRMARSKGIDYLKQYQVQSLLECGSGLGYYANWIQESTGIKTIGTDLSETAVIKASKSFPHLDFRAYDITKGLGEYASCDAVVLAEILWYVLPDLEQIIHDFKTNFRGKLLLVNQVFYKGTQQYGTDYFTNQDELIDYFPMELLERFEYSSSEQSTIETSTLFRIK